MFNLARYTHRVAISNQRLVSLEDGRVTFRYKDYADDHRCKTMTLSAEEFLRRFVHHVLPKGFVTVRHYGLLAPRDRDARFALCRRLLLPAMVAVPLSGDAGAASLTPARMPTCPQCGGRRLIARELPKAVVPPPPHGDSS